jgi:methylenetetrahydrofolate--tRNA-(uracil-5-)-methyltransferase
VNVTVVGGGLAGSEAAWVLAERGFQVTICEMRPVVSTAAHETDDLAEIVCSNSFKGTDVVNAHGLLKAEINILGSMLMGVAERNRVPGGSALVVDRTLFAKEVSRKIHEHENITVERGEVTELAGPVIIATGPLTSGSLSSAITDRLGQQSLAFFDAIAPIVSDDSLDRNQLFEMSRYGKGEGTDYLNAPLTEPQYHAFIDALLEADQFEGHEFDKVPYFEGCLPIEEMARRGRDTPRFGPMKPVGLPDPKTGKEAHAVIQFRAEDAAKQMWNIVGFQTRLKIPEQKKVFGSIPGMANVEYYRFGSIHRNTYINTPATLTPVLTLKDDPTIMFAGQLVGVEGYTESVATGLLAGINMARILRKRDPVVPPAETMLGGLMRYVAHTDPDKFQPMNANFGLLPPLEKRERNKRLRKELLAQRALDLTAEFAESLTDSSDAGSPKS